MSQQPNVLSMPQPSLAAPAPTYAHDYPPPNDSLTSSPESDHLTVKREELGRSITRTPSPTQSEFDFLNGVKKKRSWQELLRIYLVIALVVVVIVLVEVFHTQIVNGLMPVTRWLHGLKAGWLIPIVVLIALSFPPLFGHELVAMLCGLVWGLGAGFGIVAAGTLIGEICTYYLFRFACARRAAKAEQKSMPYATLAHIIRTGGLPVAVVARYSSLPGHLTTAIFATCGMPFWVFLVAAVLGLPKQFAVVYVGYALGKSGDSQSNKIQKIVIAITVVITVLAMIYIRRLQMAVKPDVVYARRKARQGQGNVPKQEGGRAEGMEMGAAGAAV